MMAGEIQSASPLAPIGDARLKIPELKESVIVRRGRSVIRGNGTVENDCSAGNDVAVHIGRGAADTECVGFGRRSLLFNLVTLVSLGGGLLSAGSQTEACLIGRELGNRPEHALGWAGRRLRADSLGWDSWRLR
jgi:hypothetical protein